MADREKCALYGISPRDIAAQVQSAVQGGAASIFRIAGEDGFVIRARYETSQRDSIARMRELTVRTPLGETPLAALGKINTSLCTHTSYPPEYAEHDRRLWLSGESGCFSHHGERPGSASRTSNSRRVIPFSQEGDAKQAKESFAALMSALMIGMVLLYFSLVPAFKSFIHPLTIMTAIPLALIGAIWSMLLAGKHSVHRSLHGHDPPGGDRGEELHSAD